MSYRDACEFLSVEPGRPKENGAAQVEVPKVPWTPKVYDGPKAIWQQKAFEVLKESIENLHNPKFTEIMRYLREERGLKTENIKRYKLGYIPQQKLFAREDWGLPKKLRDGGGELKLWIPEGIVIPRLREITLLRLRIRLSKPLADGTRYYFISGSSPAPMIFDNGRAHTVIVESDLDGFLLQQEAGDLVNVVSLGNAQLKPDMATIELFQRAGGLVLNSLDNDHAGVQEALGWWAENIPQAKRWPTPVGKDPGDALKAGVNLRTWIMGGIGMKMVGTTKPYRDKGDHVYLDVTGETKRYKAATFEDARVFEILIKHTRKKHYKARFGPIEILADGTYKGIAAYYFGEARYILHLWVNSGYHVEVFGLSSVAPDALVEGLRNLATKHNYDLMYDDYRCTRKLIWRDAIPFDRIKDVYTAMENARRFVLEAGPYWI